MLKPAWRTPNRMAINTGHKGFDSQCDGISTGNVCGKVQFSMFVRAWDDQECGGQPFPPGALRKADLDQFNNLPLDVRSVVEDETTTLPGILYRFRHWNGKVPVDHGWILTRTGDMGHRHVRTFLNWSKGSQYGKSHGILKAVLPYICHMTTEEDEIEAIAEQLLEGVA